MQNREVQNPKTKPGLDDSWICGYSVSWVVLLGGFFNEWVLKQAKDGGNFILSVSSKRCVFRSVSNLKRAGFGWFQKSIAGIVQTVL